MTSRVEEAFRFNILYFSLSKYVRIPPEAPRFAGSVTIFPAPGNGRGEGLSPAIASPISLAVVVARPGRAARSPPAPLRPDPPRSPPSREKGTTRGGLSPSFRDISRSGPRCFAGGMGEAVPAGSPRGVVPVGRSGRVARSAAISLRRCRRGRGSSSYGARSGVVPFCLIHPKQHFTQASLCSAFWRRTHRY